MTLQDVSEQYPFGAIPHSKVDRLTTVILSPHLSEVLGIEQKMIERTVNLEIMGELVACEPVKLVCDTLRAGQLSLVMCTTASRPSRRHSLIFGLTRKPAGDWRVSAVYEDFTGEGPEYDDAVKKLLELSY